VLLNLVYTITQTAPLTLRNHASLTIPGFTQGKLVDAEVDVYSHHVSNDGMKYRLFAPTQGGGWERSSGHGKRPLIVWLHGGGEGGSLPDKYYDNESLLRANRGRSASPPPRPRRSSAARTCSLLRLSRSGWRTGPRTLRESRR